MVFLSHYESRESLPNQRSDKWTGLACERGVEGYWLAGTELSADGYAIETKWLVPVFWLGDASVRVAGST